MHALEVTEICCSKCVTNFTRVTRHSRIIIDIHKQLTAQLGPICHRCVIIVESNKFNIINKQSNFGLSPYKPTQIT